MAGSDSRAEEALRQQSRMEGDRSVWESHWTEVAERVLPRQRDFKGRRPGGEKLSERIFDSTAPLALERFAAAMESVLTPRSKRWHELKAPAGLDGDEEVARYLYEVTSRLFAARYAPRANFASQCSETYMGLGAFGTGGMFVDEMVGQGLRYIACALSELFIAENFQGQIDTVHRRFERTARQIKQKFGDDLPPAILKAADCEPEKTFELLHCFKPREDAKWSRMDYRGMPWASYYIAYEGRTILREGGYRTFRYAMSRYVTAPKEVYGRSPAMTVLADIKGVNEQKKTLLRTGQKIADPPMLLTDDGAMQGFSLRPGSFLYGGLGPNGEELARPMSFGANMPITLEMLKEDRGVINDAFLVSLFQILVDSPQMTATEAMLRAQEKGALLAPTAGRQQSEMLGPLIEAELDILGQAGALPDMPDRLRRHGGMVGIEYTSPLARAQKADEGVGILRTLEQSAPLLQADPSNIAMFKVDETIRALADINGMPAKLLRDSKELAAIKQAQAQQQQAQAMLQAAPVAAGAAKDLAQAQALAASAPQQAAPQVVGGG
jgi:hypothetical protein